VLAFAHALAWVAVQPQLTAPDEDLHVGYVQALVETGDGPSYASGNGVYSTEVATLAGGLYLYPIVLHPEARPAWGLVPQVEEQLERLPPEARTNTTGPNTAAANPPLYYLAAAAAWEVWPDRSLQGRVLAARLATALLMPVCALLAWLIAAELFRATWLRPVLAGIVAFNPKLANAAAVVNPDMLLATLATACLLAALRLVRRGFAPWRLAALCLTAGAASLTHPRGLYLVPFAFAVMAIAALDRRAQVAAWWGARRSLRSRSARNAILGSGLAVGGLLACVATTYAWTRTHAGSGAIQGAAIGTGGLDLRELASYVWLFYLPGYELFVTQIGGGYGYRQVFISSFYGAFGSLDVNFEEKTYSRLQMASFLGLVALYTAAVLRRRELLRAWPVVAVCLIALIGLVGELHVVSYSALRRTGDPAITGRYLLPGIALFAAAITFVVASLPRRLAPLAGGAAVGLAVVHALGALGVALERYFG
jgi:hypothetical protein